MINQNSVKIFCDGGARGNPGPAACAFVVLVGEQVKHKEGIYLGKNTNNFAEYSGVINALTWIVKNNGKYKGLTLNFFLDSQLVVNQLSGKYKIKNEILRDLSEKIKKLESMVGSTFIYNYIPREKNRLADFLVNKTLDEKNL